MKPFDWSSQKNVLLKVSRGVGFEDVVNAINDGHLLGILKHPNGEKYSNQKVYIIEINGYAYSVPSMENDDVCFSEDYLPKSEVHQTIFKWKGLKLCKFLTHKI